MSTLRAFSLVVGLTVTVGHYSSSLAADDQVEFHETRPLVKLVSQLWKSHNYLITYEEGPYDPAQEAFTENYPNGRRFRYPAWKPITFHGIPHKSENAETSSPEQQTAAALAVAESAVAEYNSSGNPGRFQVVKDGSYVHIVPGGIRRKGNIEEFQPILDTRVSFVTPMPRLCMDVLNDLVSQIENLRGVHIIANVPPNALFRHECLIDGVDLKARSAFEQFLHQIEPPTEELRYSWTVGYDLQEDLYFLPVYPLWYLPSPTISPAPAAKDSSHTVNPGSAVYPGVLVSPSPVAQPTTPAR